MQSRIELSLLSTMLLVGCAANPVVTWQRPPASDLAQGRMAAANAKAVALRSALEAKVTEQVGTQVGLNNALLGLGILTTGLALGKVHRDAYTGTAYIAGSAYLFGTQNLSKPRLAVYQSGITAVNCALRAVAPLDISAKDLHDISDKAQKLEQPLQLLQFSIQKVEVELATVNLAAPRQAEIDASIAVAKGVRDKAATAAGDANELVSRVDLAAGELAATVEQIAEQVNKLATETVADPATVSQMIAGLAGTAGSFAPGLTLNTLPSSAAKTAAAGGAQNDTGDARAAPTPNLDAALATMRAAVDAVELLRRPLAARLAAYKGHTASDALKSCGVSDITIAMRIDRAELTFSGDAAQTQFVAVSGGVKPYVARLRESPAGGVEVKSPLPGDSSVEVLVPATAPKGTLHLLIMDGSNPRQTKEVTVTIGTVASAPPAAAPAASGAAESAKQPNFQGVATAMRAMASLKDRGRFSVGSPANTYKFSKVESTAAGTLVVTLECKHGGRDKPDTQEGARTRMLTQAKNARLLGGPPALDVQKKLTLVSDAKCLKAAG